MMGFHQLTPVILGKLKGAARDESDAFSCGHGLKSTGSFPMEFAKNSFFWKSDLGEKDVTGSSTNN